MRLGPRTCFAVANDHVAQALAHVWQGGRQRQDGHDLRRHRDVKACLPVANHTITLSTPPLSLAFVMALSWEGAGFAQNFALCAARYH